MTGSSNTEFGLNLVLERGQANGQNIQFRTNFTISHDWNREYNLTVLTVKGQTEKQTVTNQSRSSNSVYLAMLDYILYVLTTIVALMKVSHNLFVYIFIKVDWICSPTKHTLMAFYTPSLIHMIRTIYYNINNLQSYKSTKTDIHCSVIFFKFNSGF